MYCSTDPSTLLCSGSVYLVAMLLYPCGSTRATSCGSGCSGCTEGAEPLLCGRDSSGIAHTGHFSAAVKVCGACP